MKLIRISAVWCPACLIMRSRLDKLNTLFPSLETIEYDYDLDEEIVSKYNIGTTLPVFILEDNGKEIKRIIGEKTAEYVIDELKGSIK